MRDAVLVPCTPFGGGWVIPESEDIRECLEAFFNDIPAELPPLGGRVGWIVEPRDVGELATFAQERGFVNRVRKLAPEYRRGCQPHKRGRDDRYHD